MNNIFRKHLQNEGATGVVSASGWPQKGPIRHLQVTRLYKDHNHSGIFLKDSNEVWIFQSFSKAKVLLIV